METKIAPISKSCCEDGVQMYVDVFLERVEHRKHWC